MKKFVVSMIAIATVSLAAAAPASAAVVDLSGVSAVSTNVQASGVTQAGSAVTASIGNVYDSDIASEVTQANNLVSNTIDIDQTDGIVELANLSTAAVSNLNMSLAPVTQLGQAGTLSGGVSFSSINTAVTNVNNVAANTITVKQ